MVKGILNAFDPMELCLVFNLTVTSLGTYNWAVIWPPVFATDYFSFATNFYTR